ncbi:beta-N-acetylhexosaminidase [Flavivirga spongiicola]|uniref:beta-N-acetylhexosaminidase n=1 Tax=Flavivirga spongiicola TaxID=421621 RepID=A0ABU7XQ84_9FLAO|nr:beta-N-acetylhexosaminidase [Flavivirga sp. MEBiC05379]MDO5977937.1 beta-N-acetylhexosaminidase [Flavivirga sp. MEBiC05379]
MIYNNIRLLIFLSFLSVFTACKKDAKNTIDMYSIIPYPQKLEIKEGRFFLNKNTKFVIHKNLQELKTKSSVFIGLIQKHLGFSLEIKTELDLKTNYIAIDIDNNMTSDEAYSLSITEESIRIIGGSGKGVFNGLQSLRQLLDIDNLKEGTTNEIDIPNVQIEDSPRYVWRGVMVDESRHFFGKEKIKQLLELMSLQKLNKFHWHLTDAPGWRIEIKKYPKLTSIGAIGNYSNSNTEAQFYTQEDIKEIIHFASQRNIEVIPEIDVPGHASAVMRAYPEFSGGGTEKNPHFTFHPAKESTYAFLTEILKEVTTLFPSKYIHIGGDEVSFGNQHWVKDKEVIALMKKEKLKKIKEVETYFINRIRDTILSLNKKVMGWDEVVENNMNNESTVAMWWRHDKPQILEKGLKNNYKMILCPRKPLYFDFVQDDSHSIGRRWDGFCPLDDVYNFPDSSNTIDLENSGILGIQANLWTEQINTEKRFDFMLYPRISALAEAGWTKKSNKSFENFQKRLKTILKIYKSKEIYYFDYFSPENTKEPGRILKPNWVENFSTYK